MLNKKGFTALEVILVVALMAVLAAAVSPLFGAVTRLWTARDDRLENIRIAAFALDKMAEELKTATSFDTCLSGRVVFDDWEGNEIIYRLRGVDLRRNGVSLANPVASVNFTYYDADGEETSDEDEVRSVAMDVGVSDIVLSSLVAVREDRPFMGEGVIVSKSADFSTYDTVFSKATDTFYIKVWTDEVDYNDLNEAVYQLRSGSTVYDYNLDNNLDYTYTDSVDIGSFKTGNWHVENIRVADNAGSEYEPDDIDIRINP